MLNRAEPHDVIALVLILSAVYLHRTGDVVLAPMLLSTIIGFYYGRQAGKANQN